MTVIYINAQSSQESFRDGLQLRSEASSTSSWAITFTFGIPLLGKVWNPLIPPAISWIVSLLYFYYDGFGIR